MPDKYSSVRQFSGDVKPQQEIGSGLVALLMDAGDKKIISLFILDSLEDGHQPAGLV